MPDVSSRTFRTVRKGYDPDEVRRYLLEVQGLVDVMEVGPPAGSPAAASADARAEQVVQAARAQADAIIADANRVLAEAREETALQTWLGPDAGGTPGGAPQAVVDAVAQADEIIAAAKAQAEAVVREAEQAASGIDRWDGLGEHVARIVAQAEEEAKAIVAESRTQAETIVADAELQRFQLTSAASADRTEASATLERARSQAADAIRLAEHEAAELRDAAEPRAREHIDSVLTASRHDLDAIRRDLEAALEQLEAVHGLVGQSLATRPPLPEFYAAERFLNGAAVAGEADSGIQIPGVGPATSPGSDAAAPAPEASDSADSAPSTEGEEPEWPGPRQEVWQSDLSWPGDQPRQDDQAEQADRVDEPAEDGAVATGDLWQVPSDGVPASADAPGQPTTW